MGKRPQLRQSQIITTYGPGAMTDLPERSVLISGLDGWVGDGGPVEEPRLAAKIARILNVPGIQLRRPPEAEKEGGGFIRSYVFPLWFVTQNTLPYRTGWRTRILQHWAGLEKNGRKFRMPDTGKESPVTPVRFVRACRYGHLGDIDWKVFVHGQNPPCIGGTLYLDERGTSGDLGETFVRCSCKLERPISLAADPKSQALGKCDGARPWLGQNKVGDERCGEPNRLLTRAASNAWLPQPWRVISLPQVDRAVRDAVARLWSFLEAVEGPEEVGYERKKPAVREGLDGFTNEQVWQAVQDRRNPGDAEEKPVKIVELDTLLSPTLPIGDDKPDSIFFARALPKSEWNTKPWMQGFERILLVERLREVAALVGFTRFESQSPDAETGDLDAGVQRADIARQHEWVPAVENRGEGIFLQFRTATLADWFNRPAVINRYVQLKRGFELWRKEHPGANRKFPTPEYILIHSLSHLLITAISLECGYPASSLMERIYAIPDVGYGLLIYTASSDAEGTLGGLVQAGRRISEFMGTALQLGQLCSNDPVCGLHRPDDMYEGRPLHGAACHGCVLIAETSCEQTNDFLDRSFVTRTAAALGAEFFVDIGTGVSI
ncbi:MAG: DUF1998 domain-containing protein [Bryobacteraceae bacterium]|nr:DUF1998 domain-containing protein [Bryobacteraceae bacterium]